MTCQGSCAGTGWSFGYALLPHDKGEPGGAVEPQDPSFFLGTGAGFG